MAGVPYVIEGNDKEEKTYEIYSRLLKDRIIFIQGGFDDDMANSIVAQLLYLDSQDKEKDIYIYINSPGGNITSMYAIYDTMQYISPDIVTVGMGQVCSAGSFILAAGTKGKRNVLSNTDIMIHELSGGASGKATDIFLTADRLKRLHTKMANQYVDFTGQKLAKVKKDMERDHHMTAEESVKYGLVDKVVEKIPGK
jgi:ATP-dependent Clp protease protease subunit